MFNIYIKGNLRDDNNISADDKVRIFDVLILLYFILKPFYIFPSGSLQIADCILILLFFLLFISEALSYDKIRLYDKQKKVVIALILLNVYILFINMLWILLLQKSDVFLKNSSYYIFNTISVITIYMYYNNFRAKFFKILRISCISSLIILFIFSLFNISSFRSTLGFNNPNQLGYHGLVMMAILMVTIPKRVKLYDLLLLGVCIFFIGISLSKGALLACGMLMFFYIFVEKKVSVGIRFLIIILVSVLILVIFIYPEIGLKYSFFRNIIMRISSTGNDETLGDGRGYYRVFEGFKNIIWGNGEGDYYRFNALQGGEIHSTFISILVSYGIIGLGIFLYILYYGCFYGNGIFRNKVYIFYVISVYWITHNGVRNTLFWILLAGYSLISAEPKSESEAFQYRKT